MQDDPKKHKDGMIRDFLSRWGRVAGQEGGPAEERHDEKAGAPDEDEVSACSVCGAEVPPDAGACPHCGTRFVGAPEEQPQPAGETAEVPGPAAEYKGAPPMAEPPPPGPEHSPGLKKIVLPTPPAGPPAKDTMIRACPTCGTPITDRAGKCGACGAALPPVDELDLARKAVVERVIKPSLEDAADVMRDGRSQAGERRCPVCHSPLAQASEVCLVCGTAVSEKGVRRLARPFEPETDLESALHGPKETAGEELEIAKSDTDWQAWLVQGDIYYNSGQVEKAIDAYDTSLRIKASFEAYNNKGLMLYREGFLEEGLKCFDRALEFQTGDEFIWYNRGNALRDLGRFKECIEAYDRAISIKPDFERAWAAIGQALMAQGKTGDAITCFESALRINWDNEHTWHAIGSAMFRLGRPQEAETALQKAVEIRPDFWEAWYDLAELRIDLGKMKEALAALVKVTEHNPRHWRSWLECGGLLSDLGQEKKALSFYARAAELNPGSWETWRALGHEYFSLKRYNEAAQCFVRATKLHTSDPSLWLEAAESFYVTARPDAALEAAERGLRLKQTPEGWLSKGVSYATLGSTREALSSYEKGLALDPGSPRLWYEKAVSQRLLGETAGALESFDRAVAINPKYEKALAAKGRLLMELGRTREALDCLDKAVAIRPTLDKLENIAHLRQMLILSEAGRPREPPLPEARELTPGQVMRMGLDIGVKEAELIPSAGAKVAMAAAGSGMKPLEAIPVAELGPALPVPEVAPDMVAESALVLLEPPGALEAVEVPVNEMEEPPAPATPSAAPAPAATPLEFEQIPVKPGSEGAPTEFLVVEKPSLLSKEQEAARAGLAAARGLINGRGLVNGRGLTNGRGAVNGLGLVAGRGIVNGKGLVNGRARGEGLINGRGMINGRSLINGNGVVNGRGPGSGLPGGEGGAYASYVSRSRRRGKMRVGAAITAAVVVMLIIPYLAVQMEQQRGIRIDGDFADWDGIATYYDGFEDQLVNPSINLLNYSTSREAGSAFFRVQTAGRVLDGAGDGVDEVRVFLDTDASSDTGYDISGIGADRMIDLWGYDNSVKGSEVHAFNASRSREDWNGWYLVGAARAAARGTSLEVGVALGELGMNDRGKYLVSIHLSDARGNGDASDLLISNQRGAMAAVQSGLVPREISNLSAAVPLLVMNLTARTADIPLTGLVLEPLGVSRDRPTGLSNISVYLDSDRDSMLESDDVLLCVADPTAGVFNASFQTQVEVRRGSTYTVLIMGSLDAGAPPGSPVGVQVPYPGAIGLSWGAATLSGSGSLGFVISSLPEIVIDGAFGDWEAVVLTNDTDDTVNPDIDILHHAVCSDREALSFYLDVEGTMLGGTVVPAMTRARPGPPGPIGPVTPVAPLPLPVVTGEDTAAIFIDSDQNASTGIAVAGMLGAEFGIQITGREGRVLTSALYRAGAGGNWTLAGAVPVGTDQNRLETQVAFSALGIDPAAVDAVIYTTDWSGQRDYSKEARGRGGALNVTARSVSPAVVTAGISWPMLALTLTATGGPVQLYSVSSLLVGTATGQDVPRAYLFLDGDNNGLFSADDLLLPGSEGNFSAGMYRCQPLVPVLVPEGGTRVLFLVADISRTAAAGSSLGLNIPDNASLGCSALSVDGSFPMGSDLAAIAAGRGRSASALEDDGADWLHVAVSAPAKKVSGKYEPGRGIPGGRAPSGGWPANWTFLTNDSDNLAANMDNLDILKLCMTDNSSYIYFSMKVENIGNNVDVNDQWNFYFKSNNNATNGSRNMWYRLSLTVTNAAAPYTFNSALSSYTGSNSPPDRDDFTTVNESHNGTGNSTDGTAYGYMFDRTNGTIYFYVVKSQIYGNLLGPGNTTQVYADTWYVRKNHRWDRADRSPNRARTVDYQMIPEFQQILLPIAGVIFIFTILKRNALANRSKRAKRVVKDRLTGMNMRAGSKRRWP